MTDSRQQARELLAQRATEGLAEDARLELEALLAQHPEMDDDGFDLAAAAIHQALAGVDEQLPADLRERLIATGIEVVAESPPDEVANVVEFPTAPPATPRLAWWAAAACLALAVVGWWPRLTPEPSPVPVAEPAPPTVADLRQELLSEPDVRTIEWAATEDQAASGAAGDVVWSPTRQRGYMRIRNLKANDSTVVQYQLWIFDRARDERYPVDGGVFDMPKDTGDVIVPIDAKVFVNDPYLFAITVEQPGGVVVSDRERIVLVAQA